MKDNNEGFTLIELLVVIAIVGLLATLAVVSMVSASARARDAKRLSDVRSLSKVLALSASYDEDQPLQSPCDLAGALAQNCIGSQPGNIAQHFPKFYDPVGVMIPCDETNPDVCDYTIRYDNSTVGDAQILFYLERDAGSLSGGQLHWIDASGAFDL